MEFQSPPGTWSQKRVQCVLRNRSVYLILIQPEWIILMHSWSRDKLTSRWLSSNQPHCSMSNSLQCIYTIYFYFQLWVMFYLSMCKKYSKEQGGGKKNKTKPNGQKNGPEVVQGLYLCIKPLKSKSAALRWVPLVALMDKIIHGWAGTLDTYSTDPGLSQCAL